MAWFFLALTVVLAALAVHPFVTYPASLWLLRRLHPHRPSTLTPGVTDTTPPSFAICVCAYNEAAVIRDKIENLLDLRREMPSLELLLYVDGSSDGTDAIVREYADRLITIISTERRGKTYGMNRLVRRAAASIVVFTDANVHLQPDALTRLEKYFRDPDVACVCGHLTYVNPDETATAATGSLYWRLEETIKQLESDTGSVMGADGSCFAVRRHLHMPVPVDMIDDMYLSFSLLCEGYRIVRAPDVRAYEKSVPDADEEFRRKIRIACQAFNVHRALWPQIRQLGALDVYKYVSHKLLRWLTIVFLGVAALTAFLALAAAAGFIAALILAILTTGILIGGNYWRLRPFVLVVDILRSFAGAGIGVWRSLRGDRFQTWAPANSIRGARNQQ